MNTINAELGNSDGADDGSGNDLSIVDYSATVSTVGSQSLNPFDPELLQSSCANSGQLAGISSSLVTKLRSPIGEKLEEQRDDRAPDSAPSAVRSPYL